MALLYLTFILAGSLLFAFVYFYSIRSQRAKRAKMDQRLDSMVVDEMLKPSPKASNLKQQKQQKQPMEASAPTVGKTTVENTKGNDVINVPIFDDEDVVQNDEAFDALGLNEPVVEKASSGMKNEQSAPSMNSLASSDAGSEPLSRGSAMGPRSVPAEPIVKPILKATTSENSVRSSDELVPSESVMEKTDADNIELSNRSVNKNTAEATNSQENFEHLGDDQEGQASLFDAVVDGESKQGVPAEKSTIKTTSWDERESELVAKILGENAISRDDILTIFRKYDFLLARKLHIFGFNTLTQVWSDVEREDISAVFTDLGVSVQLADKSGALTRKELNTVSQLVLEYSDTLNRQFSFSMDLDDAIEIGRELDELGRRHSSMVVLNIVPKRKEGFRSSDIDSCTRDLNMSQSDVGVFTRYRRVNNRSNALYHVAVADEKGEFRPVKKQMPFRIHDVVIYLNVPTVENPSDAFSNMVDEARKLATWLDGKLVDKHHRNMTTKGVNLLKSQVLEIEQNMHNDGITPGGALSHKLF